MVHLEWFELQSLLFLVLCPLSGGMKAYSHSWHTTHELKRRSGFSTRQKKVNFIRWWVDKENIGITTSSRLLTDKVFPTEKWYLEKYLESHSIIPPQLNKHNHSRAVKFGHGFQQNKHNHSRRNIDIQKENLMYVQKPNNSKLCFYQYFQIRM